LIDNAIDLVTKAIPSATPDEIITALLKAQENCFTVGLTSIHDAGLEVRVMRIIDSLQKSHQLKMRIYCMLDPNEESREFFLKNQNYFTEYLSVRSIKLYADGALGSRGACLLEPYSDQPGQYGTMLFPVSYYEDWCKFAADNGIQICTHAIGDSANRFILGLYKKYLSGKENCRWRVEHAQVINPADLKFIGKDMIIPSIQPTHATSDMYWADKRLGTERIKHAYAYKNLLQVFGWVANGSDFPIESINPLFGFYAAIARKDQNGFPKDGFMPDQALSRKEALMGMTIWAARAAFEETIKGSIEPGKFADFVVLPKDIMTIPEDQLFKVKVDKTYIAGEEVYSLKKK
jgi:predicted amidohydrolase YtcJ